jgi:polar amino acid transport system permease protein
MTVAIATDEAPPPQARSQVTWAGYAFVGFWIVVVIGLTFALVHSIDADRLARFGPGILQGFGTTLKLCVLCLTIGAVVSIPVAAARLAKSRLLNSLAYGYSYFFRGTPIIAQLFLVYYGAGQFVGFFRAVGLWWFFRDAFNCAVFAFALNTAAYQAEILYGAVRSVPVGSWEACRALALPRLITLGRVIMPQALMTALRPYGNEMISIVKASAVTSLITVLDIMGQTRYVFSQTYDISFYLWAAVFYLIIVESLRRTLNALETRMTKHLAVTQKAETPEETTLSA